MSKLTFKRNPMRLLALGIIIYGIWGCQNSSDGKATNRHPNIQSDTLAFSDTTIKKFSPYFVETDEGIDTTIAQVTFPEFEDETMNKIIVSNMLLEGETDVDQFLDNFLEAYGNFVEENDIQYPLVWTKNTRIDVGFHTPQLIVIKNTTYEFSGGAHGNSFQLWNLYDLGSYRKLPFNTFIPDNKRQAFTKVAETYFRLHEGLDDTTNLETSYFFEDGVFSLPENFGVSKSGLEFHYNPYEIKPYVAGSTTFTVPTSAINEFLTETGKDYFKHIHNYFNSTP